MNKIILSPYGTAIDLNQIRRITTVYENLDKCYFTVYYNGTDNSTDFIYEFKKYAETKDVLRSKVEQIRNEILKMWNNGEQPKEVLMSIKLKK